MLNSGRRAAVTAALVLGLTTAVTAPASARAQTWTDVQHNVTLATEFFPDDICGQRASYETWTNKTQFTHLTVLPDGSGYHFIDFETSVIAVDYVDPTIPDTTFKWTETFGVHLTPGGTYTETTTMRQSDGTLTIRARYHLTVVDGEPKVEREAFYVSGCP